jgi:hypothetical protein
MTVALIAANTPAEASSHQETVELALPNPMTPSDAVAYARGHGAKKVLSLRIEYAFQGTLNVLTIPSNGDLPDSEVLGRAMQTINNLDAIRRREGIASPPNNAAANAARVASDQILQGRKNIITRVEVVTSVSGDAPTSGASTIDGDASAPNVELTASCASTAWLPSYHYAEASGAGVQGRYVYQNNRWNSTRMANLKCNGDTFEAEFKTYNYDGGHYMSLSKDDVLSTNCNFPSNCYLDTNAFDSGNEPQYTMGTSRIDNATAGTNYTTYVQVRVGNASVDSAKTQGQIGHRFPDFCDSTWCIFADDTKEETPGWWTIPGSTTVNR